MPLRPPFSSPSATSSRSPNQQLRPTSPPQQPSATPATTRQPLWRPFFRQWKPAADDLHLSRPVGFLVSLFSVRPAAESMAGSGRKNSDEELGFRPMNSFFRQKRQRQKVFGNPNSQGFPANFWRAPFRLHVAFLEESSSSVSEYVIRDGVYKSNPTK